MADEMLANLVEWNSYKIPKLIKSATLKRIYIEGENLSPEIKWILKNIWKELSSGLVISSLTINLENKHFQLSSSKLFFDVNEIRFL